MWVLARAVCLYTYPGGKPSIFELCAPASSPGTRGGIPEGGGAGSSGGSPLSLHLQYFCRYFPVSFWQESQLSVWLSWTIGRCHSITAFTMLCTRNSTTCFISAQTIANGFLISYCISTIAACKNPSLAIFAIFKVRHMSDCSSCTWPPFITIAADMLATYREFVTSKVRFGYYHNHIQLSSLLPAHSHLFRPL
jgi:hypothetical protein